MCCLDRADPDGDQLCAGAEDHDRRVRERATRFHADGGGAASQAPPTGRRAAQHPPALPVLSQGATATVGGAWQRQKLLHAAPWRPPVRTGEVRAKIQLRLTKVKERAQARSPKGA